MKRIARIAAASALALTLAGCAGGTQATTDDADAGADGEQMAGMANPWHNAATAAEAGEGAGFGDGFAAPDELPIAGHTWQAPVFTYMDGIAQADYDGGAVAAYVRKGQGMSGQELSGDYNDYALTWAASAGDVEVTCRGDEAGVANLVEWDANGSSYVVGCMGLGGENAGVLESDLAALVASIS